MWSKQEVAKIIDHTLLRPDATPEEVVRLCREARDYDFAAVCVNPCYVSLCKGLLKGSPVKVCTVVGFPLGACLPKTKAFEAEEAVQEGAQEIDMVLNIGMLKTGDYDYVVGDIKGVVEAVGDGIIVKVILETCLLSDEEKVKACLLAQEAGAHFVKTSTGFGRSGATAEDVALMRNTVGERMGVKAAGGIRDFQTALKMVKAGADRIGTSSGVRIVT